MMTLAPRFPEAFAMTGVIDARWAQSLPPDEGRAVLAEARAEIEARGEQPMPLSIGVMIEVPSAALTADLLASRWKTTAG